MKALFCSIFCLLPFTAQATKVVGNGGDTYAIEFVDTALEVQKYLTEHEADIVDAKSFAAALAGTKVESTDKSLVLDGVPKDAINYPSLKKILFNRQRWTDMTDQHRAALVFHEYLGILKTEGASYEKTQKLLASLVFNRAALTLSEPVTVNFAGPQEYSLDARVSVISLGNAAREYNAADEKIQLTVEAQGQRKLFNIPLRGRVISLWNAGDGIDSGIYIKVLEPILTASGRPEELEGPKEHSVYVKHAVKEYRIQFKSRARKALPEEIELTGPVSNQAG